MDKLTEAEQLVADGMREFDKCDHKQHTPIFKIIWSYFFPTNDERLLKLGYVLIVPSLYPPDKITGYGVGSHYYVKNGIYYIGSRTMFPNKWQINR